MTNGVPAATLGNNPYYWSANGSTASINITVPDRTNYYYLTAFCPSRYASWRSGSITLVPTNGNGAQFVVNDCGNFAFQWKFRGNQTLIVTNTSAQMTLQALFLDNAPVAGMASAAPIPPLPPTDLHIVSAVPP